jgi:Zn-finger nucleic acid-binding protein
MSPPACRVPLSAAITGTHRGPTRRGGGSSPFPAAARCAAPTIAMALWRRRTLSEIVALHAGGDGILAISVATTSAAAGVRRGGGPLADMRLCEGLCPRCTRLLRDDSERAALACDACHGLFVDHAILAARVDAERSVDLAGLSTPPSGVSWRENDVRYGWCPHCGQVMSRMVFGQRSGIVVDVCYEHGAWFDAGELDASLEFVRGGGLGPDLSAAAPPDRPGARGRAHARGPHRDPAGSAARQGPRARPARVRARLAHVPSVKQSRCSHGARADDGPSHQPSRSAVTYPPTPDRNELRWTSCRPTALPPPTGPKRGCVRDSADRRHARFRSS